jgi:SNF2 family DNA or RNA helicase/intein/homing endonuclease
MLVIHGIWARGALCLWAEDSSRPATSAELSGRPSRAPRPHPFAADPETIAAALASLGSVPGAAAQQAAADELTLWLPSAPDSPQAAPELIRPAGQEGAKARTRWAALGCWRVPALAVEPGVALGVLAALDRLAAPSEARPAAEQLALPAEVPGPGESLASAGKPSPSRTSAAGERSALGDPVALMDGSLAGEPVSGEPLAPGELVPGGSAVYWAAVGWFAADLAERGRVLPALARASSSNGDGDRWVARWRPVLTGHDARRAGELADAMPPLCRAAQPGGESPGPILAAALNGLADAAARARLAAARPGWTVLPPRSGRRPARIPVAERWLAALTGPSSEVTVSSAEDETEAAELAAGLAAWRDAAEAPAGPVRTCFRLVEPEPAELNGEAAESGVPSAELTSEAAEKSPAASEPVAGPEPLSDHAGSAADQAVADHSWRVQFALQSTEDPSLMLDAAEVWAGTGGWAPGGIQHPDEELLAGLGAAARLFGELDGALRTPAPDEVRLDTAGAFRFLTETAPLLAGAGFGVLLPDWARKARLGLKLTSRSRSTSAGADGSAGTGAGLSLADLVQFRYDLALGDDTLHPDELAELARLKIPLVRIRGQWVELDERNLQAALKFLEGGRQGVLPAGDVLLEGLRGPEEDLQVTAVDADGWLGDLLSGQADRTLAPVTAPSSFHGELRPYQERGLAWLSFLSSLGLGGILADSMGLGKCVSAKSPVFINGTLITAEDAWERYASDPSNDDEGEWSVPSEPLKVNALTCRSGVRSAMATAPVARLYRQYVSENLRRVRLDDGSEILITRRHRLLGLHDWTRDFSVGDRICVPAHLEWVGQPVDPDLTILLAWQIAEGHEEPYALSITQKNAGVLEDLLERVHSVGTTFGIKINGPSIYPSHHTASRLRISSISYRRFLEDLGYIWGKRSAEKRIPDFIVAADDDTIRRFMREYFSAEGSVLCGMSSVEISSASAWLMQQLACMLRRFGIWMRITEKQKRATNGSGICRPYYIGLIGGTSLRRFSDSVGFSDRVKQAKLEALCAIPHNTNVEGIPGSDVLGLARHMTRLPMRQFGIGTVYFSGTQELSRATASLAVAAMERIHTGQAASNYAMRSKNRWTARTLAAYDRLEPIDVGVMRDILAEGLGRDVFYPRIVSVEDVDYTGWVYDFEVAEHHNLVAGGMLCHNTVQMLALLSHERDAGAPFPAQERGPAEDGSHAPPTLLVCPMSLVGNWQREAERFAPDLSVYVHHGSDRLSGRELQTALGQADLVLTTYAVAARDRDDLAAVSWQRIVCDEAQNIKNAGTQQARAVRSLPAATRIALTGTPVENRLGELWSIMEFTSPGLLGPAEKFRTSFAVPVERHGDEEATARLKRLTGPFILRRLKTDRSIISDLPDKIEIKMWCNLTTEQASLYQATVTDMLRRIEAAEEDIERRGLVLATMAKLKQVCNHPAHLLGDGSRLPGRSGKLARLEEIADEIIAAGDKALVFTQYAEFGRLLQPYLAARLGCPVFYLHGGTPKKARDAMVADFQAITDPALFLLSLKAGGTGLNLTGANHVIHFDRWWNPAVEDQATDRAFRIGQRKDVQVRKFVCVGTVEERIDAMIEEKKALAERIVGTGEGWLTGLSTADLRDVLALSPEAVSQ